MLNKIKSMLLSLKMKSVDYQLTINDWEDIITLHRESDALCRLHLVDGLAAHTWVSVKRICEILESVPPPL